MFTYFNPILIKQISAGNNTCLDETCYYIGAVGDLMIEADHQKESMTSADFKSKAERICAESSHFFFQEVSQEVLIGNLFEDSNGEIILDSEVNRSDKPPHYTLNYVALKPNLNFTFWDEDVFEQMKQWFYD